MHVPADVSVRHGGGAGVEQVEVLKRVSDVTGAPYECFDLAERMTRHKSDNFYIEAMGVVLKCDPYGHRRTLNAGHEWEMDAQRNCVSSPTPG